MRILLIGMLTVLLLCGLTAPGFAQGSDPSRGAPPRSTAHPVINNKNKQHNAHPKKRDTPVQKAASGADADVDALKLEDDAKKTAQDRASRSYKLKQKGPVKTNHKVQKASTPGNKGSR